MSAEWGAQRVKGLSITKAIMHAARKVAGIGALSGKGVETSLIEQFLYPAYGPGHMWEMAARKVRELGGEIRMGAEAVRLRHQDGRVTSVTVRGGQGEETLAADHVFSTTDVRALMRLLEPAPPSDVAAIADGLQYRDFLTVGLVLDGKPTEQDGAPLTDTWMYIQEPDVQIGRVQLFHNWSRIGRHRITPVGLEYLRRGRRSDAGRRVDPLVAN